MMQERERKLIATLCLLPPGPVPCDRLERLLWPACGRAEVRLLLNRLADDGDVLLLCNVSGDRLVMLAPDPDRTASLRRRAFGPLPLAQAPVRAADRHDPPDPAADMVSVACLAADERPVLARGGGLAKRTAEQWSKRLTLTEEAGRNAARGPRVPPPLPGNVAAALDLAIRSGLLDIRNGTIVPDGPAWVRWLTKTDAALRREVYYLWLAAFAPVQPLARHAAWLLPDVPEGAWVDPEETERMWRRRLPMPEPDSEQTDWLDDLAPLREAGWIEFGETADGRPAFRPVRPMSGEGAVPAAGGRTGGPLYVQPDFELLLPASGSYALHGLLTGFAEWRESGRMNAYRLTERSVKRALERGWTARLMLDVLERPAAGRVPEEVVRGLRDWERALSAIRAEPAVLVTVPSEEAARALEASAAAGPLVGPDNRLGPGVYVLLEKEWEAFRRAAASLGFMTPDVPGGGGRRPAGAEAVPAEADGDVRIAAARAWLGADGEAPRDGAAVSEMRPGLFPSPLSAGGCRPAPRWRTEELYPGLQRVPAVWMKKRFSGHPATKLDMLRLAMEWGCRVEAGLAARRRETDGIAFLVTELAEEAGTWRIGGVAEDGAAIRLKLEELDGLRLLVPGISGGAT